VHGRTASAAFDANDPLRTSGVQCNLLTGCTTAGMLLTDIREIGILQSFPGWREPNQSDQPKQQATVRKYYFVSDLQSLGF
jgi:hypothetical protein